MSDEAKDETTTGETPDGEQAKDEKSNGGGSDTPSSPQVGTRFSAAEIHENVSKAAEEEMERPATALIWSALASGLLIGFSFLFDAFLRQFFPHEARHLAAFLAYPVGFVFVVFARHQLFTENTLEPVIPLLEKRDSETFGKLLRLWGIVLPFNLIGALIFALVLANTRAVEPELHRSLYSLAGEATSGGFVHVLWLGVWAGWLIALMAWMIASTHDTTAQIVLVWLTTGLIAAFAFKHSIAGAVEAFYYAAMGGASWIDMLWNFEVPAILGNIIGGVVLVGLINHGQVKSGEEDKGKEMKERWRFS